MSTWRGRALVALTAAALWACSDPTPPHAVWEDGELRLLRSLSLSALPPLPPSPGNRFADDPGAARLGHRLFFDAGLSANGQISCATCHRPELHFTDGRAKSVGLGPGARNAPTVVASGHAPWLFWDGRRDSLWSQALAPLEASAEMGITRMEVARRVAADPAWAEVFGAPPDFADAGRFPERASPFGDAEAKAAWEAMSEDDRRAVDGVFADVGKALEAYQRQLAPPRTRFDAYVEHLLAGEPDAAAATLTPDEVAGLRLFVDGERTLCLRCHNGPLLTNQGFHDIGSSRLGGGRDFGRFAGVQSLLLDRFNCLGEFSDADPERCVGLRFLERRELARLAGAFKTPTLRGASETAPYFHDGGLASLEAVVEHYRTPPDDPGSELAPIALSDAEAAQIVAFLHSLSAAEPADSPLWGPPTGR